MGEISGKGEWPEKNILRRGEAYLENVILHPDFKEYFSVFYGVFFWILLSIFPNSAAVFFRILFFQVSLDFQSTFLNFGYFSGFSSIFANSKDFFPYFKSIFPNSMYFSEFFNQN